MEGPIKNRASDIIQKLRSSHQARVSKFLCFCVVLVCYLLCCLVCLVRLVRLVHPVHRSLLASLAWLAVFVRILGLGHCDLVALCLLALWPVACGPAASWPCSLVVFKPCSFVAL